MNYNQVWRDLAGKILVGLRDDGGIEMRSLLFPDGTIQTTAGGGGSWTSIILTGTKNTTLANGATGADWTLTFPPNKGTNLYVLQTDGNGNTSWVPQTGSGVYLPRSGGTMVGNLLFTDNSYDIGASAATRPRTIYVATSVVTPSIVIPGTTYHTSIVQAATADWTLTLPPTAGTANYVLKTDGSGNTAWVPPNA